MKIPKFLYEKSAKNAADRSIMKRNENETIVTTETTSSIALTDEQEKEFVKAMKIGYYNAFYKQGLITAEQLEKLIALQEQSEQAA